MKKFISILLLSIFALCNIGTASAAIPSNCASFGYTAYPCVRAKNGTWWTSGNNWSGASELHIPACVYVPEIGIPPAVIPAHYVVGAQLAASEYYHDTAHTWSCGNDANHYNELWGHKVLY